MSGKTKIEWATHVWNPVRGCTRVSEGCRNCYAERMAARGLPGMCSPTTSEKFAVYGNSGPRWTGKVELIESQLEIPLHWRQRRRIFVNSMSDTFHEKLPFDAIDRIFRVMLEAPQHTFMVLTKRAERMLEYFTWHSVGGVAFHYAPPDWIWLGVSVEDRAHKDRIDKLRETPAALRFLSLEPLLEDLGELNLRTTDEESLECSACPWKGREEDAKRVDEPADDSWFACPRCGEICAHTPIDELGRGIDWVILGGESGPGARPMNPAWARSVRDQCKAAGVSYFHKQNGEWLHNEQGSADNLDAMLAAGARGTTHRWSKRGGDYSLRVGKRAAGRLLDGVEHNEMPEVKRG